MSQDDTLLENARQRALQGFLGFSRWRREHPSCYDDLSGDWLHQGGSHLRCQGCVEGQERCVEAMALERALTHTALRFIAHLEHANMLDGRDGQWSALLRSWRELKHSCKYRDQIESNLALQIKALVCETMRQADECPLAIAALCGADASTSSAMATTQHLLHPQRLWIRISNLLERIQRTMNESAERVDPSVGAFRRTRKRWVYAEALHRRALEALRHLFALLQDRADTISLYYQPTYLNDTEEAKCTEDYQQWLTTEEALRERATRAAAFLLALSGDDALYTFVTREQDTSMTRAFTLPWLSHVE
ncbi:hypothetical protein CCYA_CCYA08G2430 [Cyanidiococcus yangmingshanensis]|nr:hypothetical protein CCYA_CCYA08G2430 [Cyanidiococcus yangmingshanensis]